LARRVGLFVILSGVWVGSVDVVALERVRVDLEAFAAEVFAGFARSDQRSTGLIYLRGLMLDGQRKSMQPMAERLGADHQRLQQFLTSSSRCASQR
jgi:SRSO17 transposase